MFNFRYSPRARANRCAAARGDPAQHELDYDLAWTGWGKPF